MRILNIIARVLFILCVPVFCLSAAISWEISSPIVYKYSFWRYDVSNATGLTEQQLNNVASLSSKYFGSSDEYLKITIEKNGQTVDLFTEQEVIHFRDVKGLIAFDRRLLLASSAYILVYTVLSFALKAVGNRLKLGRTMIAGAGLTLAVLLVTAVGVLINFDGLFYQFHLLAYTNEYWSASGYMLMLFPEGFWNDMALLTLFVTAVIALAFGGIGFVLRKIGLEKDEKGYGLLGQGQQ